MLRAKLRLTRSNQVTEMLRTSVRACAIAIFVMIGVASCDRKSGEAVVIGKEHIDAALPTAGTPNAKSEPGPDAQIRAMADDEITVDGYVMNQGCRARVAIRVR